MNRLRIKTTNKHHINFHFVPTKKFKTITVVAKLKAPLSRETITKRALLPFVLQKGTESYANEKQLQMKLDELYGAQLHIDATKKGPYHIIHFQIEFANERFIEQANHITDEALHLFHEVMFAPRIEAKSFNEQVVQREKKQLEHKIESIYDHKAAYANERLIDEMFANEPFALHTDGYVEDLQAIDGHNLASYYEDMIRTDDVDLYVLGDFDIHEMERTVTALFQREYLTKEIEKDQMITTFESIHPRKIVETDTIQQAKLHIGYRTNILYKDEAYSALQVFNGLFGAFPNSKLFINVREKNSLAYYIASQIESHANFLLVHSGVETTDYEKAYSIIEEQLDEVRNGNFTEEDIKNVQSLIVSNVKETLDHPTGTIELLYQQEVGQKQRSPEEFIEQINEVKKEEVLKVANNISLDTIYVLTGKAGE